MNVTERSEPEPASAPAPDPLHVAIIMDGNGRWAQRQGLPRNEGHRRGVDNVRAVLRAARDHDVRHLTLYAFSVENWRRPADEIGALMGLLERFLAHQVHELHAHQVRLHVLGRYREMPDKIVRLLDKTRAETAHYPRWNLHLALNYGARTEVLDAMQAYAKAVRAGEATGDGLDWPTAQRYLYTAGVPDPDLVIRTSGEHRVSNFLLLQSAYAEYYFTPVCWPEFDEAAFAEAIRAYRQRERRYGRTGEQIRAGGIPQKV